MSAHPHEHDARADARPATAAGSPARDREAPRARCPRCGAPLGRLRADETGEADSSYCGCCGLVIPSA